MRVCRKRACNCFASLLYTLCDHSSGMIRSTDAMKQNRKQTVNNT